MTDITTSSVDPTVECEAITARLEALMVTDGGITSGRFYEGIEQGTEFDLDALGNRTPYRDFQPGNTIPAAGQRMVAAHEQSQPHVWAFQISHYAKTRKLALMLSIETDRSLIGWEPSTNAGAITTFYFNVYDEFAKNGERVGWIATRFYETTLGQNPDTSTNLNTEPGFGNGGYGE